MFSRGVKAERQAADTESRVVLREHNGAQTSHATSAKAEGAAGRKPSDRFVRRSLHVRSRATHSERRRVAVLADRLEQTACDDGVLNGAIKLSSYRPGSERPPG